MDQGKSIHIGDRKGFYVIGLTGGIASGKTHVAQHLAMLGAKVIDADLLGHKSYLPGTSTYENIIQVFGQEIVGADKLINRRDLGAKVFGHPENMKKLTDIVWPAIAKLAEEELQILRQEQNKIAVVEAAVLLEANWTYLFDEIWVTTVPREVAMARLIERNKFTPEEAERRIDHQMSNEERIKHASQVIDTNRPKEETKEIVKVKWNQLLDQRNISLQS